MKAGLEFNELEVWVECDGIKLKEHDETFHLRTRGSPPIYKGYLQINASSKLKYTLHVKSATATIIPGHQTSSNLRTRTIAYTGDLLSCASIDGTELCPAFIYPEQGYEAIHHQYGEVSSRESEGDNELRFEEIQSKSVDCLLDDKDEIVLMNTLEANLGTITFSIFRGCLNPEYKSGLLKSGQLNLPRTDAWTARSGYNGAFEEKEPVDDAPLWRDDGTDDFTPWIQFQYYYGTPAALSLNGVNMQELTPRSTLFIPNTNPNDILVPDSTPPSPKSTSPYLRVESEQQSEFPLNSQYDHQPNNAGLLNMSTSIAQADNNDPPGQALSLMTLTSERSKTITHQVEESTIIPSAQGSLEELSRLLLTSEDVEQPTDEETDLLLQILESLDNKCIAKSAVGNLIDGKLDAGRKIDNTSDPELTNSNKNSKTSSSVDRVISKDFAYEPTISQRLNERSYWKYPSRLSINDSIENHPASSTNAIDPFYSLAQEGIDEDLLKRTFASPSPKRSGVERLSSKSQKRKWTYDENLEDRERKRRFEKRYHKKKAHNDVGDRKFSERDLKRRDKETRKWLSYYRENRKDRQRPGHSNTEAPSRSGSKKRSRGVLMNEDINRSREEEKRRMQILKGEKSSARFSTEIKGAQNQISQNEVYSERRHKKRNGSSKDSAIDLTLLSDSD
ncbi:uncharacterized protein I206_102582 [Kwoniella pini CBS 10737]|uniref:Uncharacterized protein n=1 Tax=Kwoniella pini CBS 10737 TaxID=1296096 RepID=A0A1B9I5S4_9TREE|nr:uncharacterized protein I206_02934 [Kwoniella pini CBS 10737]OCF50876.1 hypothetical protein I206_02934 [Kwoniella pini CBS 10737]